MKIKNDSKLNRSIFFFVAYLICFSGLETAFAQVRSQIPVGTRPHSMGDAFVAVADDGNAIQWNPAGLAWMEKIQASFNYADLFGLGINSNYASFISRLYFIPPLTDYLTFGVDWLGIHTGDEELEFNQDQFNFSLAFKPPKNWPIVRYLGIGANAKYVTLSSSLDGNPEADANGWGWDLGFMYDLGGLPILPSGLSAGLMLHDVAGTNIKHKNISEEFHRQNIRWGFSYRPFEDWPWGNVPISNPVFALDFDDRVHFGMEVWLANTLALRAGIQKDLHTDEGATFSFGVGFKKAFKNFPEVNVDYALSDSPVLPNTNKQFSGSFLLRNDPRLIRIEGAHINDVFSSLYRHYSRPGASIGTIKLKNVSKDTLRIRVSFEEDRYFQTQTADTIDIAPEEPIHVPLRAVFKHQIFYALSGRFTAQVKISYAYKKNEFTTKIALDYELYEKNYLTWDDPGKAAAFVTADNKSLTKFNAEALRGRNAINQSHWFLKYNMATALKIFLALKAYGLTYRRDLVTPFPELTKFRPDKILYPEYLLRTERAGDCDDLSVLYASLLQNIGIPTALVSEPTHLFMMFDTGISESKRHALPVPPDRFVPFNGNLWIPIDAAQIPNVSFTEAWERGVDKFFKEVTVDTFFAVAAAQKKYPPAKVRYQGSWRPRIPDYSRALQNDLDALLVFKEKYLQAFEDSLMRPNLSKPEKIKIRNSYGVILGQNDEYLRAKEQFEAILKDIATYPPALNNLGNIEFVLGNFEQAESLYNRALNSALFNHGLYLNLAMLYQMMIKGASPEKADHYQEKSDKAIEQAARLFHGTQESAFAFLRYPEERIAGKAKGFIEGIRKRIEKVKTYVDKAFREFTKKGEVKKVALDRSGSKGEGKIDEERWALLWWSYHDDAVISFSNNRKPDVTSK